MNTTSFRDEITNSIVKPTYVDDLKSSIRWRGIYRQLGNITTSSSKLFVMAGAILAFLESYFKTEYITIISGCTSLFGVLLQQYSEYAYKQSSKKTLDANEVLANLGIQTAITDITDDKFTSPSQVNSSSAATGVNV